MKLSPLNFFASVAVGFTALYGPLARAEDSADKSGTNPAVLNRSVGVSDEFRFLDDDFYYNVTSFKYTEPFLDGRASVRLNVPVNYTNLVDDADPGLGDLGVKFSYVAYVDQSMGLILSGEVGAPTASEDYYGSGKWTLSPGATLALFVSPEVIIAPAYVHTFSVGGDNDRGDVNAGTFDLYMVYKPKGERWWLTADFTVTHDFENDATPMSFEVAYGRNLAVFKNGAALNGYLRPGAGIGSDRPYDFNIEVGLSLVGF